MTATTATATGQATPVTAVARPAKTEARQPKALRAPEGRFAAWMPKKVDEAYALLKATLLWAAAISLSAAASLGTATWLLLVHSHLPF